ncbi:hypothetical protein ACJZ2D_015139 [Fusarium nematophilum]
MHGPRYYSFLRPRRGCARTLDCGSSSRSEDFAGLCSEHPPLDDPSGRETYTILWITCAMSANTTCDMTNATCLCEDVAFQSAVGQCVGSTCTVKESLIARRFSATQCHEPIRDRSAKILVTACVFTALAVVAGAIRLVIRYQVVGHMLVGDYATIFNLLVTVTVMVIMIYSSQIGSGKDIYQLEFSQITQVLFFFYVATPFYYTSIVMTKIIILLLYRHIFPSASFLRLVNATGIVWSAINIALDLVVMLLPWAQLVQLQLKWKKKFQVFLMFSVGIFITLISGLRLHSIKQYAETRNPTCRDFVDIGVFSAVEMCVGVVCVCMPDIRTLLIRLWPALGTTYAGMNEGPSRLTPGTHPSRQTQKDPFSSSDWRQERAQPRGRQDRDRSESGIEISQCDGNDAASAAELIEMGPASAKSSWEYRPRA